MKRRQSRNPKEQAQIKEGHSNNVNRITTIHLIESTKYKIKLSKPEIAEGPMLQLERWKKAGVEEAHNPFSLFSF